MELELQGLPQSLQVGPTLPILGLDFWPPEQGESAHLLLRPPSLWSLVMAASGQSFQKIRSWVGSNVHHVLGAQVDTCSQHVGVCLLPPRALSLLASLSFALWLFYIPASGHYSLLLGGHKCAFETKGHLGNNYTSGPGNLERLLSVASPLPLEPSLLSGCSGGGAGLVAGVSQTSSQRQEPGSVHYPEGLGRCLTHSWSCVHTLEGGG